MKRPLRSITLTGMVTSVVFTRTTSPSPATSCSPGEGDACGAGCGVCGALLAPPSTGGRDGAAGKVSGGRFFLELSPWLGGVCAWIVANVVIRIVNRKTTVFLMVL